MDISGMNWPMIVKLCMRNLYFIGIIFTGKNSVKSKKKFAIFFNLFSNSYYGGICEACGASLLRSLLRMFCTIIFATFSRLFHESFVKVINFHLTKSTKQNQPKRKMRNRKKKFRDFFSSFFFKFSLIGNFFSISFFFFLFFSFRDLAEFWRKFETNFFCPDEHLIPLKVKECQGWKIPIALL